MNTSKLVYRLPSLFAVDTFRHFWPRILNLQIKSPFLTGKVSFQVIFQMWISEFADKKSANNKGRLYVASIIKIKKYSNQVWFQVWLAHFGIIWIWYRGHSNNTWHSEGGFDKMSHNFFLLFEMLFLRLLDVKLFDTVQDKASKDSFFLIHLKFQSNLGLKLGDWKLKNVTRGGGGSEKRQKSVTYYLNGPLGWKKTFFIPMITR